ncbi:MAG: hypothetical protein IKS07_04775 [Lachnospiraceae bacterium]|nr:hypothetical protein [Lachnospiraceae bacterium]
MPKNANDTLIPEPKKKPAGLKQHFSITSSFSVADLEPDEFEALVASKDIDEIYAEMSCSEQMNFMACLIGRGRDATSQQPVQYFLDLMKTQSFHAEAFKAVAKYLKPSEVLSRRKELAHTVFMQDEAFEFIYDVDIPENLEEMQEETLSFLENLPNTHEPNPKTLPGQGFAAESRAQKAFWSNAEIRIPEWFAAPQELIDALQQAKLPFAKQEGLVKHLFESWLLGEKGYSPEEVFDGKTLSKEAKQALGAQFLQDVAAHPAFGAVEGGEEKIREGVRWYAGLYSKAAMNIAGRGVSFPSGRWNKATVIKNSLYTEFGYTARFAKDLTDVMENFWGTVYNQPSETNNYGINYLDEFKKGYADPAFEEALTGFRKLSAVEDMRREIVDLGIPKSTAPGISATYVAGMDKLMSDLAGDKVFGADGSAEQADRIEAMTGRLKDRAQRMQDGAVTEGEIAEKYAQVMKGTWDPKAPEYADFAKNLEFTQKDLDASAGELHFSRVSNALSLINKNHKEGIYSLGLDKIEVLSIYSVEFGEFSEEEFQRAGEFFDRVFQPLADAEKPMLQQNNLPEDEYLGGFTAELDGERRVVLDYMKERYLEEHDLNEPIPREDMERIRQQTKACILQSMTREGGEVQYRTGYRKDGKIVRVFSSQEISTVPDTVKVDYDQLDGLGRELQNLINGAATVSGIDPWYHKNSTAYKAVRDNLNLLSQQFTQIRDKREEDSKYLTRMPRKDWDRLQEQLSNTMNAISAYEEKRRGTTNKVTRRRLAAIAPLKAVISRKMEVQSTMEKRSEAKEKAPKR